MADVDPPVRRPGQFKAKRDRHVGVRLTAASYASLERLAIAEDRTVSDMVRVLMRRGMEASQKRG